MRFNTRFLTATKLRQKEAVAMAKNGRTRPENMISSCQPTHPYSGILETSRR